MIHGGTIKYSEAGANRAALEVICAVNEAVDAGLKHCASAHRAGFDGDVKSDSSETVISHSRGGCAQRDDFSVRRGIAVRDGAISGARNDAFSVGSMDDYAAYRYFSALRGQAGLCERQSHVIFIEGDLSGSVAGIVHRASE